jgi:hypothetical protein
MIGARNAVGRRWGKPSAEGLSARQATGRKNLQARRQLARRWATHRRASGPHGRAERHSASGRAPLAPTECAPDRRPSAHGSRSCRAKVTAFRCRPLPVSLTAPVQLPSGPSSGGRQAVRYTPTCWQVTATVRAGYKFKSRGTELQYANWLTREIISSGCA